MLNKKWTMNSTEELLEVFKVLGIDTEALYINTLEWYIEKRKVLLCSEIDLEQEATGVKAHISNLVVTPRVKPLRTSLDLINIQGAYIALSDYGFEYNDTKLLSTHTRFQEPIDCRITIYATRIDCKGANSLLAAYVALEYTFSLLSKHLYNKPGERVLNLGKCEACNLVVTCQMGFKIPVKTMVAAYKHRCVYKTPKDRTIHRKSNALFHGAIYTCTLPNGAKPRILFQDRASVTCVACKTYNDVKLGLEEFYRVAFALLPLDVQLSLKNQKQKVSVIVESREGKSDDNDDEFTLSDLMDVS
jgi:hypothetical protein